jgi:hypothetical protein
MTRRKWPGRHRPGAKRAEGPQAGPRRRGLRPRLRFRPGLGSVTLVGLLAVTADGASLAVHPTGSVVQRAGLASPPSSLDRAGPPGADGGNPVNLAPPPIFPAGTPRPGASGLSLPPVDLAPWAEIPKTVLAAYRRAAAGTAASDPGCHLPVALLAAIGEVESGQADGGAVDSTGTTLQPILGPVLDGTDGYAAIPNTYGTQWDQSGAWARAVGPMQFIPSTWASWGAGGNPNNVYAAALAAARYLCAGGQDLATSAGLRGAIESYNDSYQYLVTVLEWMSVYSGRIVPVPDSPFMTVLAGASDSSTGTGQGGEARSHGKTGASPATPAPKPAPRPAASGGPAPAPSPDKTPAPASTGTNPLSPLDRTLEGTTKIVNGLVPPF